jgi:hypothetical protein
MSARSYIASVCRLEGEENERNVMMIPEKKRDKWRNTRTSRGE